MTFSPTRTVRLESWRGVTRVPTALNLRKPLSVTSQIIRAGSSMCAAKRTFCSPDLPGWCAITLPRLSISYGHPMRSSSAAIYWRTSFSPPGAPLHSHNAFSNIAVPPNSPDRSQKSYVPQPCRCFQYRSHIRSLRRYAYSEAGWK